jgi:hypothetical protein
MPGGPHTRLKLNERPDTRAGSGGLKSGSILTVPVNHSDGPLAEGCAPVRLISIAQILFEIERHAPAHSFLKK